MKGVSTQPAPCVRCGKEVAAWRGFYLQVKKRFQVFHPVCWTEEVKELQAMDRHIKQVVREMEVKSDLLDTPN